MMKNNKGLSDIVVTLIIIVISLAAIGLVWFVVNNLVKSGSQNIDVSSKCLGVDVEVVQANCTDGSLGNKTCDITLSRTGSETSAIGGVKLIFRNSTAGVSSTLLNVSGNIQVLVGKKETGIDTQIANTKGIDKIEITPFFLDNSGREQLCTQTSSFSF
ncbi:Uncharacterised protein [uncultured archaeon]|nr:Uncharacterised protein [uncultured archaeon]